MISERVLRKWRIDALQEIAILEDWDNPDEFTSIRRISANRILSLTQELLDQYLLNKANKNESNKITSDK